jgi:hypothetical protein
MDGFMQIRAKHFALLLEGLAHALAESTGFPLYQTRSGGGLWPGNALGKAAAKEALECGWLAKVRSETRGKSSIDYVVITPAGQQYLLEQGDPKPLLEAVQASLHERARQLEQLHTSIRLYQHDLDTLQARLEVLADKIHSPRVLAAKITVPAWPERLTAYLQTRQQARPAEDCPLSELFEQAKTLAPELTVGEFHDGLRQLQQERRIALQPWTGPLHELPEPKLALLQGHSLAYYACPAS